jgi:predicted NBD/HSP70 family sugar kinase
MQCTDGPMSANAMKYLLTRPTVPAPLDPNYMPFVLGKRKYVKHVNDCADKSAVGEFHFAVERPGGCCGRDSLPVFNATHEGFDASVHLAGEVIRYMLWQRGGYKVTLCGPAKLCELVTAAYSAGGKYEFEAKTMPKIYGEAWSVSTVAKVEDLPAAKDVPVVCGKEASGCRIAFDLGKSDVKTVAVKDGEVLDSAETEWDVTNPDPQYHYDIIVKAMKDTAAKLPSPIVAIGGSATGAVSADSEATWCDCFPNVPPEIYKEKVVPIFNVIAKNEFGGVPIKVINDGEVTAVAGGQMIGEGSLFGISLGSSEGSGYVDKDGNLTGWINENAYCPCDLNPESVGNVWSPHRGDASMYLGQRAATRLAKKGGIDLPEDMDPAHPNMNQASHVPHAQCLKKIQAAMKEADKEPTARLIYESIGVFLGYTIAQYCEYLDIKNVLILGRVTSGNGGQVMMDVAKKVLEADFPELAHIKFHTPSEHMKRVGQCVAAAALPEL